MAWKTFVFVIVLIEKRILLYFSHLKMKLPRAILFLYIETKYDLILQDIVPLSNMLLQDILPHTINQKYIVVMKI